MKTETLVQPHIKMDASGRPHQSFYQKYEATILGGIAVLIVVGIWQAIWSYTLARPVQFEAKTYLPRKHRDTENAET